jgi:hypothetical protein
MKLPIKHLSARVPWHDGKWNGEVCEHPDDNSFCRVLRSIDANKDVAAECARCKTCFDSFDANELPPCAGEKGAFMSGKQFTRNIEHRYKTNKNKLFVDFLPAPVIHKPFSFNAVPFRWLLKDKDTNASELAELYGLEYDCAKETVVSELLGFSPNWVQHRDNQRELLNSFFGYISPRKSLVFFYAPHTPLSDTGTRVLLGAAYITVVGDLIDYEYPPNYKGHKTYVWDRIIQHSLSNQDDGVLLPYHDLVRYETENPNVSSDCRDCVAEVPDRVQFSHASELVENDTAIDALFAIQTSLKKSAEILGVDYKIQMEWLDNAISEVWDMRGAYPSMGSVLLAKKFENGNAIAWNIEKHIAETYGNIYAADAWEIFDDLIVGKIIIPEVKVTPTMKTQWSKAVSDDDKRKMRLASRIQMDKKQAEFALKQQDFAENPYVLFENSRRNNVVIGFNAVDKAMYPVPIIAENFPLTETSAFDDGLDIRRVRALTVQHLENAADRGDTIAAQGSIVDEISNLILSSPAPITAALLENYANEEFFRDKIHWINLERNYPLTHGEEKYL